jgi:predicted esterase
VTLLLLHGTGGNEEDLLGLGREIHPAAALLSPRGRVLEHGMPRFFRRLAEGVFDIDDLVLRTHELAKFVDASSKKYGFDPASVFAIGYSNGANIASSLLLLYPGLLRGAILFRPMVPFIPEKLPDLSSTSILMLSGLKDQIVPGEQPKRLLSLFQECKADVTLHWEDSTHALTGGEVDYARDWLAEGLTRKR